MNQPLKRVIDLAGGQSALAARLRELIPGSKVQQAHVWTWLNSQKSTMPPAEYVLPIVRAVNGRVTPHDLRPDIYPHPDDGLPRDDRPSSDDAEAAA